MPLPKPKELSTQVSIMMRMMMIGDDADIYHHYLNDFTDFCTGDVFLIFASSS